MPRMGKNIYKRNDGRYEGRYIKGYDVNGKAKYGAVYAKTYAETKEKLKKAKENINKPKIVKNDFSVEQWYRTYLSTIKECIKVSTYNIYYRYCTNHINPYFKGIKLSRLSREKIQNFIIKLSENGLSARTVQAVFIFMCNGLKEAYSRNYIGMIWENIHIPHTNNRKMRVFTIDEQKRIEAVIEGTEKPNDIGVYISLYTGLRIGELCALRWSDIDFNAATLSVQGTLQRVDTHNSNDMKTKVITLSPKSSASERLIPLPSCVLNKLTAHRKTHPRSTYVLSYNGKPVEPRAYRYRFKKILEAANVVDANFHATRHTFATRALELGFDVKTLSEILGHSSAAITLNKYAHSLDDHKRSRMELLTSVNY